jgi:hypothetical protein
MSRLHDPGSFVIGPKSGDLTAKTTIFAPIRPLRPKVS